MNPNNPNFRNLRKKMSKVSQRKADVKTGKVLRQQGCVCEEGYTCYIEDDILAERCKACDEIISVFLSGEWHHAHLIRRK